MSLFREEVLESRRDRLHGQIVLTQPISTQVLSGAFFLIVFAIAIWITLGSYARVETVPGILITDVPSANVVAPQNGVVTDLLVVEGAKPTVEERRVFVKISTSLIGLSLAACAFAESAMDGPRSGIYLAENGDEFSVRTDGPTALSVTSGNGLCLQFWRSKDPSPVAGVETLRGQACTNDGSEHLSWLAGFAQKKSSEIILYPPGAFENHSNTRPIKIVYRSSMS